MNCDRCGRTIPEGNNACPFCASGGEQAGDGLAGLVALAGMGTRTPWPPCMRKPTTGVFYTIKSMIRDEDTVLESSPGHLRQGLYPLGPFSGRHKVFSLGAADRGQHRPGLPEKEKAPALYRHGSRGGARTAPWRSALKTRTPETCRTRC